MAATRVLRSAAVLIALGLVGWGCVVASIVLGVLIARCLGSIAGYLATGVVFLSGLYAWYRVIRVYRESRAKHYEADVEIGRY